MYRDLVLGICVLMNLAECVGLYLFKVIWYLAM
ncbi:hypothetical protein F383_30558 [Gossypium arboreum]|uniref:Uncharacterized protein n=1 Tax=Gossypium arboreum TaxID=29729 RepID=A0A0B0P615_GOSAR|nr:hypothetical protein F383_26348 [Gossypium arboreum]KHG24170.1 hypothetical protein F383_30558 [Gossypium arboreum]